MSLLCISSAGTSSDLGYLVGTSEVIHLAGPPILLIKVTFAETVYSLLIMSFLCLLFHLEKPFLFYSSVELLCICWMGYRLIRELFNKVNLICKFTQLDFVI